MWALATAPSFSRRRTTHPMLHATIFLGATQGIGFSLSSLRAQMELVCARPLKATKNKGGCSNYHSDTCHSSSTQFNIVMEKKKKKHFQAFPWKEKQLDHMSHVPAFLGIAQQIHFFLPSQNTDGLQHIVDTGG